MKVTTKSKEEHKKYIENTLIELASISRTVDIHIIAATQQPYADVITCVIKMNIPAHIAFKVSSKINSLITLYEGGAEQLISSGN